MSVIERISKLNLPRRICRPLERGNEKAGNAERQQFDAAIEAAVEAEAASDQEWAVLEDAVEVEAASDQERRAIEAAEEAESANDAQWSAI